MKSLTRPPATEISVVRLEKSSCLNSNTDGLAKKAVGWCLYGDNNYRFNIRLENLSQMAKFEWTALAKQHIHHSQMLLTIASASSGVSRITPKSKQAFDSTLSKGVERELTPKSHHSDGPLSHGSHAANPPPDFSTRPEARQNPIASQAKTAPSRKTLQEDSAKHNPSAQSCSRSEHNENLRKKLFKKLKINAAPSKPTGICKLWQKKPSPEELAELCLNDSDGSKSVQAYLESLAASELQLVRQEFERRFPALLSTMSGTFTAIFLLRADKAFFDYCESLCLSQMGDLLRTKSAFKLMEAVAEQSAKFSRAYLAVFQKNFNKPEQTAEHYLLLNKAIPQVELESDLDFLLEEIERTFVEQQAVLRSQTLRVVPPLLERLSAERAQKLSSSVQPFVGCLVDDKLGMYTVLSLLKNKHPESSRVVCSVLLQNPLLMFTRKPRMTALAKMLAAFEEYPRRFLEELITGLMGCRDLQELKYIFHYEDSICLLLNVLIKLENPALVVAFNNEYFKVLFANQTVVRGPIFRGFQRELNAITDLSICCIQEAANHERYYTVL